VASGHGKFSVTGKTKPRSNPGKSRVRGGSTKSQPKAQGKGPGQGHEKSMKGSGY
jgi:hypothetical protein